MQDKAIIAQIDRHIEQNVPQFLDLLARLCAQPSVSAQNLGIEECAALVADILQAQGFAADIMPSAGYPVVFGTGSGASERTLLFYLHYDVQPPEPLELWDSPPWEMTRRGDQFFARGISDDKGHIIVRLAALAAVRAVLGELPCRVKFVIEGEEEIGSPSMEQFVDTHRDQLAGNACIWEFGGVNLFGAPTQMLGMRGITYVELSVRVANRDIHSGLGGSIMPNAAWRLAWALGTLKDAQENVLIPGFYDDVLPPTYRDLELLATLPDESGRYRETYGLDGYLHGLTGGVAWQQQSVFQPTCTICGLDAGYQGPGSKTVQPAEASAKIDFRLVPNQSPEDIIQKLRAHLDDQGFADVDMTVYCGEHPARVDPDHPFVQLAVDTGREVYGQNSVVYPMIGGSGPLYPFVEYLGVPVVSAGLGYPGNRAHAPNENIRLSDFVNGVKHTARIITGFAGL
jgi:acetylornithine deacetylase/succinyl-diaminopimelate desuccinylase-like protein